MGRASQTYMWLRDHRQYLDCIIAGVSATIAGVVVYLKEQRSDAAAFKVGASASYPLVAGRVVRYATKAASDAQAQLAVLAFNTFYTSVEAVGYSHFGSDRPIELALLFGIPAQLFMAGLTHALRHPGTIARVLRRRRAPDHTLDALVENGSVVDAAAE